MVISLIIGLTQDENGYWYGNEYIILDSRSDSTRILEDDLITVYGEFAGMEIVTRVLGQGYQSELPSIKMFYVDIASEKEQKQSEIQAKAMYYINNLALSKTGIIQQMKSEGYNEQELKEALNKLDVDWNEQAVKAANWYLSIYKNNIDREMMKQCLEKNEGFTSREVEYALRKVGF